MKNKWLVVLLLLICFHAGAQTSFKPDEAYKLHAARAYHFYEQKQFLLSAQSYDSLFKQYHNQGTRSDQYNAACSWALAGKKDKAFHYLQSAVVQNQWSNLSHVTGDSDLVSLHADKRWQPLINVVKKNKAEADAKLDKPLAAMLDTIYHEDQDGRRSIDSIRKKYGSRSPQMDSLWKAITYQDSVNLVRIKHILDTRGWLGQDIVGQNGALTIFLVIQHADSLTQVTYLPAMREAVKQDRALPQNLALLEDRILMRQGKLQIYGSQLKSNAAGKLEFSPIADEANVNKRRAAVGLEPLEEYAKRFGIDYTLPAASPVQH